VQRLGALLNSAIEDGLISVAQRNALLDIYEQAITGEGQGGRGLTPITDREGDIAKMKRP
jgi:hypothetical protein